MASASGPGGTWQKKLTLMGASVAARMAPSSSAMASGESMAQGSAPRPPALATAMASSLPWAPAMGAWKMKRAIPSRSCRVMAASLWRGESRVTACREASCQARLQGPQKSLALPGRGEHHAGIADLDIETVEEAHAEQRHVALHAGADGAAHLVRREAAEAHLVEGGQIAAHPAVGGVEPGAAGGLQPQALGQVRGDGHVGGSGIEQELHRLAVDAPGGHEVAAPVALQHQRLAVTVHRIDQMGIGIALVLEVTMEPPGSGADEQHPEQQHHAEAGTPNRPVVIRHCITLHLPVDWTSRCRPDSRYANSARSTRYPPMTSSAPRKTRRQAASHRRPRSYWRIRMPTSAGTTAASENRPSSRLSGRCPPRAEPSSRMVTTKSTPMAWISISRCRPRDCR